MREKFSEEISISEYSKLGEGYKKEIAQPQSERETIQALLREIGA